MIKKYFNSPHMDTGFPKHELFVINVLIISYDNHIKCHRIDIVLVNILL